MVEVELSSRGTRPRRCSLVEEAGGRATDLEGRRAVDTRERSWPRTAACTTRSSGATASARPVTARSAAAGSASARSPAPGPSRHGPRERSPIQEQPGRRRRRPTAIGSRPRSGPLRGGGSGHQRGQRAGRRQPGQACQLVGRPRSVSSVSSSTRSSTTAAMAASSNAAAAATRSTGCRHRKPPSSVAAQVPLNPARAKHAHRGRRGPPRLLRPARRRDRPATIGRLARTIPRRPADPASRLERPRDRPAGRVEVVANVGHALGRRPIGRRRATSCAGGGQALVEDPERQVDLGRGRHERRDDPRDVDVCAGREDDELAVERLADGPASSGPGRGRARRPRPA